MWYHALLPYIAMGWLIFGLYLFGDTTPSNKFWRRVYLRTINRK